jgi:hypothetical protein
MTTAIVGALLAALALATPTAAQPRDEPVRTIPTRAGVPLAPHGYFGIDAKVVDAIAMWIVGVPAGAKP